MDLQSSVISQPKILRYHDAINKSIVWKIVLRAHPLFRQSVFLTLFIASLFLTERANCFECTFQQMNSKGCLQELVQEDYRKGKIFDISQERVFSEWSKSVTGSLTEWEYIGSINGYHVVRTSIEGDTWRNYSLTIVKVLENEITATATIPSLPARDGRLILAKNTRCKN